MTVAAESAGAARGRLGGATVLQKAANSKAEEPLVKLMDGVGSGTNGCK